MIANFLLHGFPTYVSRRSIGFSATFWLGAINWSLFLLLGWTGFLLMLYYVPAVEKAYASVKDIEYVVTFGRSLRVMHRLGAHFMVALVTLHMMRVWYTGAYKSPAAPGGNRRINWLIGMFLLLITLAFSFTGYLLPWDQLAYWAVTIGSNIVSNLPLVGERIRKILLGGTELGQNALIRFYVFHCVLLPLLFCIAGGYHMWRIRRDRGLAVTDHLRQQYGLGQPRHPSPTKTYMLLGVRAKTEVSVTGDDLPEHELTRSHLMLLARLFLCLVLTHAVIFALSFITDSPLEEQANPFRLPNPAKAPWYFIWLQELSALTTFKVGNWVVNGGFVGGILIPSLAIGILSAWPFLDRSPDTSVGVWFHGSRLRQNILLTIGVLAVIVLIVVGVFLRGPFWNFYWFGRPWPEMPL